MHKAVSFQPEKTWPAKTQAMPLGKEKTRAIGIAHATPIMENYHPWYWLASMGQIASSRTPRNDG